MKTRTTFHYVVLLILSGVMLLPLLIMLNTSLKTFDELVADPPRFFPETLLFDNYVKAFTTFPFGTYLGNTLILPAWLATMLRTTTHKYLRYEPVGTEVLYDLDRAADGEWTNHAVNPAYASVLNEMRQCLLSRSLCVGASRLPQMPPL